MPDNPSFHQTDYFDASRPVAAPLALQHSFNASGDITHSALEFLLLRFAYKPWIFTGENERSENSDTTTVEVPQELDSNSYSAKLPPTFPLKDGKIASVADLLVYMGQHLRGSEEGLLDSLTIPFSLSMASDESIPLGSSQSLQALLFLKNFFDINADGAIDPHYALMYKSPPVPVDEFFHRNAFLINRVAYDALLAALPSGNMENSGVTWPLYIIACLTDLSSGQPMRIREMSDAAKANVSAIVNVIENDETTIMGIIDAHYDSLFDFPVSTESIQLQQVAGTMHITGSDDIKLTPADFALYDLSLEYEAGEDGQSQLVTLQYDWDASPAMVKDNATTFSFSASNVIMPAESHEPVTLYVRSPDGMILWSKEFKAGSHALSNISISVKLIGGGAVKPSDRAAANNLRLRGQVLDMTGGAELKGALILLRAKTAATTDWQIVGSALSDKEGYFSLPHPKGEFTAAEATISLNPDNGVPITIGADKGDGYTIADDFIYLLLNKVVTPEAVDKSVAKADDCDCHDNLKATRLPDQADLIHSDEYTQDLGAGCINLSTPNRTLREYSYTAIVRTSDPDVANYVLTRAGDGTYTLELKDGRKVKRRSIDLTNPIRWQDAPDMIDLDTTQKPPTPADPLDVANNDDYKAPTYAPTNLSFYQAVTVATGHVLHYKSQFKADGYSLGELLYSLPLAPGQKKQIVVYDNSHNLTGSESQQLSVSERLASTLTNDRNITDQLGGSIAEGLRGGSKAETAGVSAAVGAAGSFGSVGASLGVAGGFANASSEASQDSSRTISQFFGEKLRNSLMQNADSYRQQNASVVTTVTEGQRYAATTEVVANHNHCHSLTMMYFEVLKHYAIYQELASVEECVFVPLLMTHFTPDNVQKWQDVLAANLLPVPANTYLPSVDGLHPLIKGFDAIHRRKVNYMNIDFPVAGYDEEAIRSINGQLWLRVNLPRPKTRFDRIMSLPVVNKTIFHEEIDVEATMKAAAWTCGISMLFGPTMKTVAEVVQAKAQVFDQFMQMDANWESVPPAQSMRVTSFRGGSIVIGDITIPYSGDNFFGNDILDRQLWMAYSDILGFTDVYTFLDEYFKGKLIAEWDHIFYNDIAPVLYQKLVKTLQFTGYTTDNNIRKVDSGKSSKLAGSFTPLGTYTGGETMMLVNVRATTSATRADLGDTLAVYSSLSSVQNLHSPAVLVLESMTLTYSTPHFNGLLYSGFIGDDLQDGATLDIPETLADKRNPRKEDAYIAGKLIDHLNSNVEHYNKVLWYSLDPDRRYMLLDGFNIQVFNDFGQPIGLKSLASIVKNELISVAGNSLVFPVSAGFKVGRSYITEKTDTGDTEKVDLLDHYKPLTPQQPFRLSVPTKGLFVEAVKGQCDSCEKVEVNTSQDWDKFKADEPTTINSITAPTPTVTDWKATFKDIASATLQVKDAPDAPAPGAGMQGLSDALTKADTFKDVTGLAGNQANAASTFKANTEAATKMAEVAKGLAEQEHNTDKSEQIMQKLKDAKESGAISQDEYNKMVKKHLSKQISGSDGDDDDDDKKDKASANKAAINKKNSDIIANAASAGKNVDVTLDDNGNPKSIKIDGKGNKPAKEEPVKTLAQVSGTLDAIGSDDEDDPAKKKSHDNWAIAAAMMMNYKDGKKSSVADQVKQLGPDFVKLYNDDKGMPYKTRLALYAKLGLTEEQNDDEYSLAQYVSWVKNYGPVWVTIDSKSAEFSPEAWIILKVESTTPDDDENSDLSICNAGTGKGENISIEDFNKEIQKAIADRKDKGTYNPRVVRSTTRVKKVAATAPAAKPAADE